MSNAILQLVGTHIQDFQNDRITSDQMWEAIVEDLDAAIHEEQSPEAQEEILELAGSAAWGLCTTN